MIKQIYCNVFKSRCIACESVNIIAVEMIMDLIKKYSYVF